jgi:RNA polymerase sigma factor (sigma-70 family)
VTPDANAIDAVKNGDKDRYAELVERYQKMVYGIAWSRLGDANLCEDAAQETFIKAFRYLVALRNPEKFGGWLARIAQNVSTSLLRKRGRDLEKHRRWQIHQAGAPSAEPVARDEVPLGETLRQSLADLPDPQRECLVLFYLESKSVRETASVLGISEAAVKTRLHRARHALRGLLEERIEASLEGLGPRKGFSAGVMMLLPQAPWAAAGIGGSSIAAKVLSALGKAVVPLTMAFWMAVFNGVFLTAMFGFFGKLEAANLVPGPGKNVRTKLIRNGTVALVIVGLSAFAFSLTAGTYLSFSNYFRVLAAFCAWGTFTTARQLRVNRTPFVIGNVLAISTFLAISMLIGFFHAPFWIFFAFILPLNIILYHTNKSRPMRHDYNLFLRQAQGLLGESSPEAVDTLRTTEAEMRGFARFLGERFLVHNYTFDGNGIVLLLPPVRPQMTQYFGLGPGANSRVRIGFDGSCEAELGKKDLRQLHKLLQRASIDAKALESEVATAVRSAYGLFLEGRSKEAEGLLQAESNEQIFVASTGKSKEHRVRGGIAIAAAVFLLVSQLWLYYGLGLSSGVGSLPKPVSRDMARDALGEWGRQYPSDGGNLFLLMNAEAHPPLEFIREKDRAAYRSAMVQLITHNDGGDLRTRILRNLGSGRGLYHVIENGLLSKEELSGLGFTSVGVRAVLEDGGMEELRKDMEARASMVGNANGASRVPDVAGNACLLACLKEFECLDLVDADRIVAEIIANQVTPEWEIPPGYQQIDREEAAGLFHFGVFNLRGTRDALWMLQILGKPDLVDRESCLEGILRFYKGKGLFRAERANLYGLLEDRIPVYGHERDTFHAMECLAILDGLDRIDDLQKWRFESETDLGTGKDKHSRVTSESITTWAYQLRLEELRGD